MESIVVEGGVALNGKVQVSGAKNSALPLLFSTLLVPGEHQFSNVPMLKDIESTQSLLESLGSKVVRKGDQLSVTGSHVSNPEAHYDLVRKMRASVLCLGPLLTRYGFARVSLPGGCAIGARPINLHIEAMEKMGAQIKILEGYVEAKAEKLVGTTISFDNVTVTGTENVMMAAVLAHGETILENAAKEPEVVDLAHYLKKMGAKISGEGTSVIRIIGVNELKAASHRVMADRIEAGTLLIAGAITSGDVEVCGIDPVLIEALTSKLKDAGFDISTTQDSVRVLPQKSWRSVDITTAPYPEFPTDLQAQFMALMTLAQGTSIISETIFENRFMHVTELIRLGADISPKTRIAVVRGKPKSLIGAPVMATDLRASACLVLAGLAAKGKTTVNRIYHLDRGYEKLEEKLQRLGAKTSRIPS